MVTESVTLAEKSIKVKYYTAGVRNKAGMLNGDKVRRDEALRKESQ